MTLLEALKAARQWVADHEWIQGDWRRLLGVGPDGEVYGYCLLGSIDQVTWDEPSMYMAVRGEVFDYLWDNYEWEGFIGDWNDAPERTKDEVLELLDAVIAGKEKAA